MEPGECPCQSDQEQRVPSRDEDKVLPYCCGGERVLALDDRRSVPNQAERIRAASAICTTSLFAH
jgi:hypothetical protein